MRRSTRFSGRGQPRTRKSRSFTRTGGGNSQWYMVKDANNNWALNSATGDWTASRLTRAAIAEIPTSTLRILQAWFASIMNRAAAEERISMGKLEQPDCGFLRHDGDFVSRARSKQRPGTACTIDNSGYISNTGSACGTGSGGTNGTVNSGNAGQVAYYAANGTVINGMSALPITARRHRHNHSTRGTGQSGSARGHSRSERGRAGHPWHQGCRRYRSGHQLSQRDPDGDNLFGGGGGFRAGRIGGCTTRAHCCVSIRAFAEL